MAPRPLRRRPVALAAAVALLVGLVGAGTPPGGPSVDSAGAATDQAPPAERVLVLSLPNLLWEDIDEHRMPALWSMLDEAAVANLSLKVQRRAGPAGDSYATIGAGTRALASDLLAGVVLEPDEQYGLGTAAEEFERRTGTEFDGAAGLLTLPSIVRQNAAATFGGRVGLVGRTLVEEGFAPAVIANSDRIDTVEPSWHREAALALMGTNGILPAGRLGRDLLAADPIAPGGTRLDVDAVVEAFDDVWGDRAVVLVEASDLRRVESQTGTFTSARRRAEKVKALVATDELIAELVARTDPATDAVLVIAPSNPGSEPRLTVAALRAPGTGPERLYSGQTRRPGYVTITDVGPTILDLVGVEPPATMEGRPFVAGGGSAPLDDRIDGLRADETDARFRDQMVGPVTNALVVAHLLLLVAVAVSTWRGGRRIGALRFAAVALLAVLPLTYLAGLLPFADWGAASYWAFLVGGALTLAAATAIVWPRRNLPRLVAVLSLDIAVICTSVVLLDSELQFNTVLGDSPIVAGRFGGVNNVTFAQLFAAGIILAAVLAHRPGGTRGRVAALSLLIGILLVDVMPFWGADVGGILAGVPAIALTTALLLGLRVHLRTLAVAGIGTALAVGALAALDLSRPAAERSHLGRLFERLGDDGSDGLLLVIQRKLEQNLAALTGTLWLLLVIATALIALYLAIAAPRSRAQLVALVPPLRAAGWGLLVTGVLGMALNDSGIAVPGMMLAVANPALVVLMVAIGWPAPAEGRRWATWWHERPAVLHHQEPTPSIPPPRPTVRA